MTFVNQKQAAPELLLPAGKFDSLRAAVAAGADAVYLAGSEYGARASAGNFDEAEMRRAVRLCRKYGVKLYVTMNTLVSDAEFPAALDYAHFLYELGVDALIVQDLGLAAALHRRFPALPLSASTQCSVHNAATARFVRDLGFARAILARETTLDEIRAIHDAVPELELEVFCHGALCICYSGQCLMSSIIGGRSGNRGRCAQPCRLPYTLVDGKKPLSREQSHPLSTRDLNTLELLPELAAAGVVSLKVEGRMRRPEYVATVGRVYRTALDRLAGDYFVSQQEQADVRQSFNRDFTAGYFRGNPGAALMSGDRVSNRGVAVGRVREARNGSVSMELTAPLSVGDVIEIWVKVGGRVNISVEELLLQGKPVRRGEPGQCVTVAAQGRVRDGDRVFKTFDAELSAACLARANDLTEELALELTLTARLGEPLTLFARDELGHEALVTTDYAVESARNPGDVASLARKQLSRLGQSGYTLSTLTVDAPDAALLPAAVLNQARRDVTAMLDQRLFHRYPVVEQTSLSRLELPFADPPPKKRWQPLIAVKVRSRGQAEAALAAGAELVCIVPHLTRRGWSERDWQSLSDDVGQLALSLPAILPEACADRQKRTVEQALRHNVRRFLAGQTGDREWLAEGVEVWADSSIPVFNEHTAQTLYQQGFGGVCLSPELNGGQLEALAARGDRKEVLVHGALTMMISRHCLLNATCDQPPGEGCGFDCRGDDFALIDRMNMRFPLHTDSFHLSHIYNSRELCLIAEAPRLTAFERWRIDGMFYDHTTLKQVISLYRRAREGAEPEQLTAAMRRLLPEYTKGHFYRGV